MKIQNGNEVRDPTEEEIAEMVAQDLEANSLSVRRARIITAADRRAKELRDQVTSGISAAEMASWPIKRAEALGYMSRGVQAMDADAPLLAMEAQTRGCSTSEIVVKVIAKANALAALEAAISGRCGAIQDAARAAGTVEALAGIDVGAGWPV